MTLPIIFPFSRPESDCMGIPHAARRLKKILTAKKITLHLKLFNLLVYNFNDAGPPTLAFFYPEFLFHFF